MSSKPPSPAKVRTSVRPGAWLVGGGAMGEVIRAMDWSATPLGPIEAWPPSLRTAVGLCLASNLPIALAWGPQRIQIYNDGYWPICGGKHPGSMGHDFSACWSSAWPVIGAAFERARAGETSYVEDQRMFLDRNGYLEETFFSFSFSPIRDETGRVAGLFHPVTESTARLLTQRRTHTLRDLAARTGTAQSAPEALAAAARALSNAELDIPFALFYLVEPAGGAAQLIARAGLAPGTPASPERVSLDAEQHAVWPLAQVAASNRPLALTQLEARFGPLACGPYPEPVQRALVLPITPGGDKPAGLLVLGVSTRLPFDDAYRVFLELVGAGVTAALEGAQLARARREGAGEVLRANKELEAFSYAVSHDLRAPLRAIEGFSAALLEDYADRLDAEGRAYLQRVRAATLRMGTLIDALLDLSRLSRGTLRRETVDITALGQRVLDELRVRDAARSVAAHVHSGLTAHADPALLTVVLENLLSNAWKFTGQRADPRIELGVLQEAGASVFYVRDNGAGFDPQFAGKLFQPFQRLHPEAQFGGTGIGLATVQRVLARHGGRVWVDAAPQQGATFFFTLGEGP